MSRVVLLSKVTARVAISFLPFKPVLCNSFVPRRFFGSAKMDPSTSSNYDKWLARHTTATFQVDFDAKRLVGSVLIELESLTDRQSKEIILDSSYVDVQDVKLNATSPKWEVKPRSEPNGSPLHVSVPDGAPKGEQVKLEVQLATTEQCTALQWLTPEQTSNKKAPFVFSQGQTIHARSLFPCQDTPAVKSTYDFNITSPYVVIGSGLAVGEPTDAVNGEKLYRFEQKIPIPSYLFAIASGDIVTAPIGKHSVVATGPNEIEGAQWEFEADMDKFLAAAEKIVFPYRWGQYNVLVLPPSFPYGGMENPIFTFATPTLLSGDRQNVDTIAHELAHSWSGNLVTNRTWEHYWLNEGWTMYLERRILAVAHGPEHFDFSAIMGWKKLQDAVDGYGATHEFTKLCINHDGIDPDDAFSSVPYEKGFHLVYFLDRTVGRANFDKFIKHYFTKYAEKTLTSQDFRDTFMDFFLADNHGSELHSKIHAINWDDRFYSTGMPPKPEFDTTLADQCYKLADKWHNLTQPASSSNADATTFTPSPSDMTNWIGNQKLVFLNAVEDFPHRLSVSHTRAMASAYGFEASKMRNVELLTVYYSIALRAGDKELHQPVAELLGKVGRMKFVRPLYRALDKVNRPLALETFETHRMFYHPICRAMVEKDLGLAEAKK
jgi:leukotriene-A4 hydrolase